MPPVAVTEAVPLQILPQFKSVWVTVKVIAGGWVIVVENVAVHVLESVTVIVTTPGHNVPMVVVADVDGVDEAESHE